MNNKIGVKEKVSSQMPLTDIYDKTSTLDFVETIFLFITGIHK
jgi:hypothetical protein